MLVALLFLTTAATAPHSARITAFTADTTVAAAVAIATATTVLVP